MQETSVTASKELNLLDKSIQMLDKAGIFSRWINIIGIAFLFLMILFTTIDVVMRYIFNQPMVWVLEITEVMMIVAIFLAVSHTQNEKGHISIDIITSILKPKPKLILEFITTLLSLGTVVVVVWRVVVQTLFFISRNSSQSQFLTLPKAPFAAILALGCATLALLLLRDLLRVASKAHKIGLNRFQWTLMLLVPVLITVLILLWMQPNVWISSLPLIGVLGVLFSLILFLIGMPISFSLILTSIVFTSHIRGISSSLDTLGTEIYRNAGSYSWSVLPFFVMMGFFCFHARFGEDLYLAAYRWFGHMRGGLAISTIAACTGFAAIVGDGVAATATMGAVAVPEMRKYGYDDRMSTGSVTGGATLGPIIPPSTLFIIYGVLTSVSIGSLFVAGIIPGLLIAAIYCFIIAIWCRLNPSIGPAGTMSNWKDRIVSLKAGGPVIVLFLLVIGGIYLGIFTPTEGGAIGAMGSFIIGLILRRWTRNTFSKALLDSGKTVSMVFLILIGALIFTRFAAWCNLSGSLSAFINSMSLSPGTFMMIVLLVTVIFGCFIDIMPLVLIGVPVLYPVATSMGIDPLWFGIMFCISVNLGALTPPVGINLFVFKGMFKEIPMGTIYRGAIPFLLGTIIAIVFMFFVPSIVTWLPGIFK